MVATVTLSDIPPHVSAMLLRDLYILLCSLALFYLLNRLMIAVGYFADDENGRYFSLHVLCNTAVTALNGACVLRSYAAPWTAVLGPANTSGTVVIFSLHLFHILFFRPLPIVDWVHHIVMIIVMLPLAYLLQPGALLGHGAFFSSGLPGGLDYLMLVLVKRGTIESMTEKRLNAAIQTWIRNPGCLFHALFSWQCLVGPNYGYLLEHALLPTYMVSPAICIVMVTFFWNGPYFQRRVCENYGFKRGLSKLKARS